MGLPISRHAHASMEPTIFLSSDLFCVISLLHVGEPGGFHGGFLAGTGWFLARGTPRGGLGGLWLGAVYDTPPDKGERWQ